MPQINDIGARFPLLASRLERQALAQLPTPAREVEFDFAGGRRRIAIKRDDLSAEIYGGNKVRKLEYLLRPVTTKRIRRFATFGTVGSHHALATALYARALGYECTCFLAHQRKSRTVPAVLATHLGIGTDIVRYGGSYQKRMQTLRQHLWGADAWVIPAGGSSWWGTVGFVNAGLELAEQIRAGEIPSPHRVYIASGTLGSAAGLALGLALAELTAEVHAVRVSHTTIANDTRMRALMQKTATMLHRIDASFPADLAERARVRLRHDFFAGGYAHTDEATEAAIRCAASELGLHLESTYTGKAMAALLHDLGTGHGGSRLLFWNTYCSRPLPESASPSVPSGVLPAEFRTYLA